MEKIKGYANYGVLAHEKQVIFTVETKHPHADVSEEVEMELPEGWKVAETESGVLLIESPEGETWPADKVIDSFADAPALSYFDGVKGHRITLKWNLL